VGILTPLRDYIESLVHPTAQRDALTAARHRAFIAPRLLGSFIALAAFPLYLSLRGVPSMLEVLVFGWLIAPILIAYFLSHTGRYESAHVLSSLALSGLVAVVAFNTGGIGSFAAIWLVVVPLEAALSASRRVVALASSIALGAAAFLLVAGWLEFVPALDAGRHGALAALSIISASLYATGLALGAESLARTSFWLLNAEEDRYRLLARNMTDVITRHGRNGAVLFVSPAAEPLFGIPETDLHGHGLFDRVHVADRPAYLTALADAASLGEARSVEFRARFDAPAGVNFLWLEMRCRPLDRSAHDRPSEVREVVAVLRDVTERKAQEIELDRARDEADRANAAKTRFLATMSHELRTPLNVIIGFSDMLVNEDSMRIDAKRRTDYAQLINDSGHHLLSVVNGILDMSKIENGNFEIAPEPFAPGQVVDACCELLALKAREGGIDLLARIDKDLPEIVADKRAMTQIMLNLMSNALKFTPAGGKVTVAVRIEGPHLVYSVSDTGVGISAEDLPRLGEPFFQARGSYDRKHDGTGLGLSIVKGLLTLHGGELQIHSRPDEGTRISVKLPLDCDSARRAQAAAAAASAAQAKPVLMTAKIFQSTQLQVKKSA
jgi:cell cycle sensor histidine kinase DivJ